MNLPMERGIPSRALEEAADWFASLGEAGADRRIRQRWQAWLDADPAHAQAWQAVERISGHFSPLRSQAGAARRALEVPRHGARRRTLGVLAAVLTLGAPLAALRLPWREWEYGLSTALATHRSGRGESRAVELADGGSAWIGSDSALDVDYGPALRRLRLLRGDLLVHTAADTAVPPRPFVVDTVHGRLRALGTRFAVHTEAAHTRIDVFEGAVELSPAAAPADTRVVAAGEYALLGPRAVESQGRADLARSGLARGVLVADGLRLDELLAELGRWHPLAIGCMPDVGALRVVGTYPLQEPERVLAALEASLPVRIERGRHAILIAARPAPAAVTPPRRRP
ncbi:FecR domain-containing protein [Thauera sinica]|uniref:FecR domain-containing protein n=1 Tax=Thauera sinica TaxID=2665146 RepID=A0ABW1AMN1_9RHOO|nr:FecR domain-containing protein [Thauera sp. K11]ATE60684.1 iron dicitrate transport regulator FecR [Thauera sp. K11]